MSELPDTVSDTAVRLTKRARTARSENVASAHEQRRDELLAEHRFVARVREDDTQVVLVLYPADWIDEDGVVRTERIEDTGRAVERVLSGVGDPDDWDEVDARNRAVVEKVSDNHGSDHAANVAAFADFMGNHYAKSIADASPAERREFREEYYRRNVWPTDEQAALLEESIDLAVQVARDPTEDEQSA